MWTSKSTKSPDFISESEALESRGFRCKGRKEEESDVNAFPEPNNNSVNGHAT